VLDKISDPDLRVYAVWVPILTPQPQPELERNAVREAKRQIDDPRVVNLADPQAAITRAFPSVLGIASFAGKQVPAWDVYMVYDANQTWTPPPGAPAGAPPRPAFWQHQLSHGAPPGATKLNGDNLREYIATFAHAAAAR
jgi:hypothetical protein